MTRETLNGKTWTADDLMAVEDEVRGFIYALVRLVKPRTVIETGCYTGRTTSYIVEALGYNGRVDTGRRRFHTCDTDATKIAVALNEVVQRTGGSVVFGRDVEFHHMSGVELISQMLLPIDFAFLDSGGDRSEEAQALLPKLSPGAVVVIHDSRRPTEQAAIAYLQAHAKTELLTFETPRGCAVLRVWPDDTGRDRG